MVRVHMSKEAVTRGANGSEDIGACELETGRRDRLDDMGDTGDNAEVDRACVSSNGGRGRGGTKGLEENRQEGSWAADGERHVVRGILAWRDSAMETGGKCVGAREQAVGDEDIIQHTGSAGRGVRIVCEVVGRGSIDGRHGVRGAKSSERGGIGGRVEISANDVVVSVLMSGGVLVEIVTACRRRDRLGRRPIHGHEMQGV